jgi:hypothetical protein
MITNCRLVILSELRAAAVHQPMSQRPLYNKRRRRLRGTLSREAIATGDDWLHCLEIFLIEFMIIHIS